MANQITVDPQQLFQSSSKKKNTAKDAQLSISGKKLYCHRLRNSIGFDPILAEQIP